MDQQETTNNTNHYGPQQPAVEFKGVAELAEKLKPTIPPQENGFIPLNGFDPKKPYEDWHAMGERHVEFLEHDRLTPSNYATELRNAHDDNQRRREDHLKERTDDWKRHYDDRTSDLTHYHAEILKFKDAEIQRLKDKADKLERENEAYQKRHEKDWEDRMTDLKQYHADMLALTREIAQARLERLAEERTHLDTERNYIRNDQDTLAERHATMFTQILEATKAYSTSSAIMGNDNAQNSFWGLGWLRTGGSK